MSPRKDDSSVRSETEQDASTSEALDQLHPDLTWTIERPYQKGALTQSQISNFNEALRTGRIRVTQTGQ